MNSSEIKKKGYYWNGYLIILILAVFLFLAIYKLLSEQNGNIYLIIYVQLCGVIFLLSYYFENNNFIFKLAMKICEKYSTIKSRKNAFFYFGLATLITLPKFIYFILAK